MALNKEHPKYPEYIEKCHALADICDLAVQEAHRKAMDAGWNGKDESFGASEAIKTYNAALKALQMEYHFMFDKFPIPTKPCEE